MRNENNKKRLSPLGIGVILIAVYMAFTFAKQEIQVKKLSTIKVEQEKTLEALEKDVKVLKGKINKTNSIEYIEKIAREELKMVKPNEIIYIDKNKSND